MRRGGVKWWRQRVKKMTEKGEDGMEKRKRIFAALLTFAVCFVMLFSAFYIAAEANHDCIKENCPICYHISVCENTLKSLGYGVLSIISAIALTFSVIILRSRPKTRPGKSTLITLKVKLSN